MSYILFVDDERNLSFAVKDIDPKETYRIARSSAEAIAIVKTFGWPGTLLLDHDLSNDDIVMNFLKVFAYELWNGTDKIPLTVIHSQNPIGKENIKAFMRSWKKSL